jgi:lysozyme family protein
MAASSFDEALRRLFVHEGGYGNHPADPGGPTNYGITLHDFRKYVKANAGAEDVKTMSLAQAKAIYRARYWNALSCDRLPAGFDYALFDYGVNSGVSRAAKVARALIAKGSAAALDDACIAALNAADTKALVGRLCDERLAFLQRLKTWPVFGRGWGRRVAEVRAAAMALATNAQRTGAPQPSAKSLGKGVVPLERAAQRGSAGAVVAGGAVAAQQAHAAAAPVGVVLAIVLGAAALATGAWLFWRWRQRQTQNDVPDLLGQAKGETA